MENRDSICGKGNRIVKKWWKETVFYQIYMPSFCDGNGDGIGDFAGIRPKLPYLKQLGVGGIWLTPFYTSPKVDQGYDISDYYSIDPDYGTMEDFDAFIREAHELGIRVISDVVINHTSTRHPWFVESRSSETNSKRDWYVWKKPVSSKEPNNWESFFGGSAWEYDAKTGMYYYHSFAKEQADLNWANDEVKRAVFEMLDFWVHKGMDGFRLDVINNLTLTGCMEDNPYGEDGKQLHIHDVNQNGIHTFMNELKAHLCRDRELFLVGEISSDELERIHSFAVDGELDTTFNFNLGSMERFDFPVLYGQLEQMARMYGQTEWPTVFFGSHDMARFPSRFQFGEAQVKSLFTLMCTFRGIPFLYFGDEIGMRNYECREFSDARDIQGILAYRQALSEGKSEAEALNILDEKSRDHSRNTMYWNDSAYGGFSDAAPWIGYQEQPGNSAEVQMKEEDSLLNTVKELIRIRTECETLSYGKCEIGQPEDGVILIRRWDAACEVWAAVSFTENQAVIDLLKAGRQPADPQDEAGSMEILFRTQPESILLERGRISLAPYGSAIVINQAKRQ